MNKSYSCGIGTGLAVAFLFTTCALEAQRGATPGGGGPGVTTGGGGGTTTPGRTTTSPFPPNTTTQPNTTNPNTFPGTTTRPIFLSGKVMLSDGGPPPEPATLELLCGGNARPQGYTDSKGRFSFQLGQNTEVMADASYSPGIGGPGFGGYGSPSAIQNPNSMVRPRDLTGCELRASLAGFRSDSVNLASRRSLDDPDVGTIILHRMANVEGLTISATSAMAPKDARKAFEKGREQEKKGKIEEAEKDFEKAVDSYPKFATAWNELGRIHEQKNEADAARKAYSQALAADAKFVSPYEGMYRLAARENKWPEVAEISQRVIHLNPYDFPAAYFFNAVANLNLKNLDAAEKSGREAVKLDTRHENPRAEHVLAVILAQKQDLTGATEHMHAFLKLVPKGPEAELVQKQLAQIDAFAKAQQAAAPDKPAAPEDKPAAAPDKPQAAPDKPAAPEDKPAGQAKQP